MELTYLMSESIKSVFEQECSHIKINTQFARRISQFERDFVNRTEDHIEFLGGNLIGSPPFRFHSTDRNHWFDDVLEIDDVVLKSELHALESIIPEHKVSSDPFSLSIAYVVHALEVSNLSQRQKEEAQVDVIKVMHYRFLSSLMSNYFKYEPDRSLLQATYAALNYKFALKREGSWAKLIESRSRDVISRNSIHRKTIERFDDDEAIKRLITDVQGRIREVVKKITRVFYEVRDSQARVVSKSALINLEGELQLRSLVRKDSQYKDYIHSIISDKSTLIRKELVEIIIDIQHTMPERHLHSVLEYMSDNYGSRGDKDISPLVDEIVIHAFEYISRNRSEFGGNLDLGKLLERLRSLYMSSRSTDPSLLKIRELALNIVNRSVRSNNNSLLASIRTGVVLYIVLRTFAMKYYTST